MADFPKVESTGTIKQVTVGTGDTAIALGGESAYPFHTFEGKMPHPPRIAMEIWDRVERLWQK